MSVTASGLAQKACFEYRTPRVAQNVGSGPWCALFAMIMETPRYVCALTVRDFSAFACWATSVTMRPAKSVRPNCGSAIEMQDLGLRVEVFPAVKTA